VPIDDHRHGGEHSQGGWKCCTKCKRIPSIDLDAVLTLCYKQVNVIVQLSKGESLPSNLDVKHVEQILDLIQTTTERLNEKVNIGHWLSCRLHDSAYHLTRALCIRCRRYESLMSLYNRSVNMCAIHSRIAIMAWAPIIASTSSLMGHLLERASEAVTAEAGLLDGKDDRIKLEKKQLLEEAKEFGRQAHHVLNGVCGVY
jgi:hypothetical protein